MQRLPLPPLNALKTFEAAARHKSFKHAAEELCVTQAAVSKQIQMLEEYFGFKLFNRNNRCVVLSKEGEVLFKTAHTAFTQVAECSQTLLRQHEPNHVSLFTTTSFAQLWFMPRFRAFNLEFPDVQLHLISGDESPNYAEGFETAITLGWQEHPDYIAIPLFSEEIFPICTPEFLAKHPNLKEPKDLLSVPLLNLSASYWKARLWTPMDWQAWFSLYGIAEDKKRSDIQFSQFSMLLDAVHQGVGVGLGWKHLVENSLDEGRLIKLFKEPYFAEDRVHYFVCHRSLSDSQNVAKLKKWLIKHTNSTY